MKDETYVFISDVKEKGSIGRSARNRKTHAGKGGRVRLPHDNLTKKELQKMNGECKSFRLNEPMSWKEFKSMPDDIKITYIKLIREKFGCSDIKIGEMMGADKDQISRMFKKLGLNQGKTKKKVNWDKEGFYAWVNGVDKLPTPVIEEEPIQEPVITSVEPEELVEEDLPFDIAHVEEPDCVSTFVPVERCIALEAENEQLKHRIDELIKTNEELQMVHTTDKDLISWQRIKMDDLEKERDYLKAQMEVVQLIFGGK